MPDAMNICPAVKAAAAIGKRMTDSELCVAVDAANHAFDMRYGEGCGVTREWTRICRIYREIERRLRAALAEGDMRKCSLLTEALHRLIYGRRAPEARGKEEWFYTLVDATMGIIEAYRLDRSVLAPQSILPHLLFARSNFPRLDHIVDPLIANVQGRDITNNRYENEKI